MGSLVAELAEKLSSATNNFDIDEGTIYVNTSADTVAIGGTSPDGKFSIHQSASADILNLYDGTTAVFTVLDGGNVGVGTTAPDQLLVSAGTGNVINKIEAYTTTAAQGPSLILARSNNGTLGTQTAVDAEDLLGGVYFQGSSGTAFATGPNILAYADETWSGTASGSTLRFFTTDNTTTTSDERMRIDHNGKVGIGTTAPAANLHIFTETDETDEGTDAVLTLGSNTSGKMRMYFGVNDAGNYTYIGSVESGTAYRYLTLQPNGGQVGIGTTAPEEFLHIESGGATNLLLESISGGGGTTLAHFKNVSKQFSIGVVGDGSHSLADTDFVIEDTTANAPRLTINDTGNIGIGALPLATHTDEVSLRVGGLGMFNAPKAATAGKSIRMSNNVQLDTDDSYEYIITDEASMYSQYGGAHRFYVAASGTAGTDITFTQPAYIDSTGDIRAHDKFGIWSGATTVSANTWKDLFRAGSTFAGTLYIMWTGGSLEHSLIVHLTASYYRYEVSIAGEDSSGSADGAGYLSPEVQCVTHSGSEEKLQFRVTGAATTRYVFVGMVLGTWVDMT